MEKILLGFGATVKVIESIPSAWGQLSMLD